MVWLCLQVLKPCSVVMETRSHVNQPLTGSIVVEEVVVKVPSCSMVEGRWRSCRELLQMTVFYLLLQISPFLLSTVMTITAAMRAKAEQQKEEVKLDVGDLWSVSNVYNSNYWFLGVEEATEVTESFREAAVCNEGESFSAQIKVPHTFVDAASRLFSLNAIQL